MPVMAKPKIRLAIVGGSTAMWSTATALSRVPFHRCSVRLVEPEAIGVGPATPRNGRVCQHPLVITTVPPPAPPAAMARLTAQNSTALPPVPSPAAYRAAQTRQLLP